MEVFEVWLLRGKPFGQEKLSCMPVDDFLYNIHIDIQCNQKGVVLNLNPFWWNIPLYVPFTVAMVTGVNVFFTTQCCCPRLHNAIEFLNGLVFK